jgi:hypothetical protein
MKSPPITDEIASVRATIEGATAKLRELEERAKKAEKWQPKGGPFTVQLTGEIFDVGAAESERLRGAAYPTYNGAVSALPYLTSFQRLCALAQELNPSGKVGGKHYVVFDRGSWKANSVSSTNAGYVDSVFETKEAAEMAAKIMNRDGWTVPNL